jgi:hypothetical protein
MQSRRHLGLWLFLCLAITLASISAAAPSVSTYQSLTNALSANDEILIAANSTINFPAPISISRKVKITGAAGSSFDGQGANRLFLITPGGNLTLLNLEIRNGRDNPGPGISATGGAIKMQDGELSLSNCTFLNNSAIGGASGFKYPDLEHPFDFAKTNGGSAFGGAIAATNSILRVDNCLFLRNAAIGAEGRITSFGGANYLTADPGRGGGGALFLEHSILEIGASSFSENWVQAGNSSTRTFVHPSSGGAISAWGRTRVLGCIFKGNRAINGGAGALGLSGTNSLVSDCHFVSNSSTGNLGDTASAGAMGAGTDLVIRRCVFAYNSAVGGLGYQGPGNTQVRSGAGIGGALAIGTGQLIPADSDTSEIMGILTPVEFAGVSYFAIGARVENCIFLGNRTESPDHFYGANSSGGAALAFSSFGDSTNAVTHCSFFSNVCVTPTHYFYTQASQGTAIYAGTNFTVALSASIVSAGDTNTSIAGNILDGGWNVYSENVSNLIAATSVKNIDPKLLIDTNSYSLVRPAPDSPAINRVATTQLLPTDIRGVARPLTGSDSGAVELEGAPALSIARTGDQLRLQTSALVPIELFASTNLLDWRKLGALPPNPSPEPASYTITNQTPFQFYQAKAGF